MANVHKHPARGLRGIPQDLWDRFETATGKTGTDRSAAVADFIRWFLREPDAKLPKRPHD